MIVFVKADGSVQSVLPSPVYQGSSLEGSLYFVAPFPATNAVDVAFVRANGDVIGKDPLTLTPVASLPDVLNKLGTEYNVWEWQTSNADVTAYAGEVTMQFRVVYAGQTLATASTKFTVQEGVIPQPVEPSADQWDTLIELYSRLNAKVPDAFLTDIAISEPDEDNIVTVTKYYNNGTTATEEFPVGGTSFSVKSEWVKVIDFTTSAWVNASSGSGYELAFPPSQTGYSDNKFLTSLESTETGGYSTLADTVFKGSDGSVLISATEKYNGRLITLGGGIWGGVNVTAGAGENSVQQVGGAKANGKQSAAFGFETIANSEYETVVGRQNVRRTDALFQVGNGTDENNRKDAFTVLKDGRAKLQTAPSEDDDVVRRGDLGKAVKFPYGDPTVTYDTTDGMHIVGTMRVYTTEDKSSYYDIENVDVEIPIAAGDNTVSMDANSATKQLLIKALKGVSSAVLTPTGALEFTLSDGTKITTDPLGGQGVDIGAGLPASATNGVLTAEQLALLQASENNYIMFQHEKYYLEDKGHVEGYITYTHTGYESNTYWIKSITITVSTRAWVLNKGGLAGKGLGFDADGKLQVKAGANLSFGADGTLNASGGGTANEYANTSEIVDNAITLTSTSTLDDLVTQILAQKTKVVRASWSDNLARLLGTPPELTGPPISQYSVLFKTIYTGNQTLISAICIYESYIDVGAESFIGAAQGASAQYSGWRKLNNYYPIGSIYMSTVENNYPSLLFGGTWEQIKDVFLLAAGDTYTAGSTGGSADAVVVLHDHIEYGTNTGGAEAFRMAYKSETGTNYGIYYEPDGATVGSKGVFVRTADAGESGTGKNMPPYLAVYMWRRVA